MTFEGIRRGPTALLLAAIVCASPCSQAAVKELKLTAPRPFGYVIGDIIEHRVSLVLDRGFELDPASIPEPGRASRLLALNEAELDSEARNGESRHTIRLRYQVVNTPSSVTGAGTPHLSLRVLGPEGDLPVVIPAWGFTVGPVVTPEERSPGRLPSLRPALPPPLIPTDAHTARVIALGALALALLVPIVRDRLAGRRGPAAARHFDRAYRRPPAPGEGPAVSRGCGRGPDRGARRVQRHRGSRRVRARPRAILRPAPAVRAVAGIHRGVLHGVRTGALRA